MTDARTLAVNPQDYKISRLLFARVWRLGKPYWLNKAHWRSWLLFLLLLEMAPAWSYFNYRMAHFTEDMTNAIVAKQQSRYAELFWFTTIVGIGTFALMSALDYVSQRINLHWARWLTNWLVARYLAHRTYYDIAMREDLDNPDQRIQGDVEPVIATLSNIPNRLLSQAMNMITGGVIIAGIDARLTWFVIGYAVLSTFVTIASYTPSIRLNFQVTVTGADLRYGILHVRDNAETVAFYKGEQTEHAQIRGRLDRSIDAQKKVLLYQFLVNQVSQLLQVVWNLAPFFLIAPLFFQGKIEYGAIAMATMAAGQMMQAMNTLITFIPSITSCAPSAVRLAQIVERFDQMEVQRASEADNLIAVRSGPAIAMEHVSLETPGGEQKLFRDLDFELAPGTNMVIVGQTGVGKSSLLRALAGLWRRGSGRIVMPALEQCLFLPQRPYMILANLRSQLLYPHGRQDLSDELLQQTLERVCLPHMLEKHGGLDAVRDWGKVLSLGEQQRIAFARILISGAKLVFLDEATSAVDIATEAVLYRLLQEEGIAYVSVGHRQTILAFHDQALELFPGGGWHIVPIEAVLPELSASMELEFTVTSDVDALSGGRGHRWSSDVLCGEGIDEQA